MKIRFNGESLFLAPIQAIDSFGEDPDRRIVATAKRNLKDKNTFLWLEEPVTGEVDPHPIINITVSDN